MVVQEVCCGRPLQVSVTAELKSPMGVRARGYVADWPGVVVAELCVVVNEKSIPLAEIAITCGLPGALSVKVRLAVRVPPAVGLKRMLTVQEAAGDKVVGQLLVSVKSPVLMTILEILKGLWPPSATVKSSGPNDVPMMVPPIFKVLSPVGVPMAISGPVIAVPARLTTCGPAKALSLIIRTRESRPDSVGANATVTVQLAPGPRPVPQVLVKLN